MNTSEVNQRSVSITRFDLKSSKVKLCNKLKQRYFGIEVKQVSVMSLVRDFILITME